MEWNVRSCRFPVTEWLCCFLQPQSDAPWRICVVDGFGKHGIDGFDHHSFPDDRYRRGLLSGPCYPHSWSDLDIRAEVS